MNRTFTIALVLALAGCGTLYRERIEILDSRYDDEITVLGIERPYDGLKVSSRTVFLRSFVEKATLATRHEVYLDGYERRSWFAANDESATPLQCLAVAPRRGRSDDAVAFVEEPVLRNRRLYGYGVKFFARDGATQIIRLTPEQIGAQIDAVDAVRAELRR